MLDLNFCYKQISVAFLLLQKIDYFCFVLLTNQNQGGVFLLSHSEANNRARFPARGAVYMHWIWVLIGSLND